MKTAWRKLLRINQIYMASPLLNVDTDTVAKVKFRSNDFTSNLNFGHLITTKTSLNHFPLFTTSQNSAIKVSMKDGHIGTEATSDRNYLYIKLSGIGRLRFRLYNDGITFQSTLPSKFGEVTTDLKFGKKPTFGTAFCIKDCNVGFLVNNSTQFYGLLNKENLKIGVAATYSSRVDVRFGFDQVMAALRYTNDRFTISPEVTYRQHLLRYKMAAEVKFPYYKFVMRFLDGKKFDFGVSANILKLLNVEGPEIETSVLKVGDGIKCAVSGQIDDHLKLAIETFQPYIGRSQTCLSLDINYKTDDSKDELINEDDD